MYNVLQTGLLTVYFYIHSRPCLPVIVLKQIHLCLRATGLIDIVTPLQKEKNLTKYTDFCSGLDTR